MVLELRTILSVWDGVLFLSAYLPFIFSFLIVRTHEYLRNRHFSSPDGESHGNKPYKESEKLIPFFPFHSVFLELLRMVLELSYRLRRYKKRVFLSGHLIDAFHPIILFNSISMRTKYSIVNVLSDLLTQH